MKHLVLNNLPLDDIKTPIKAYNKDDFTQFMDDFKSEEQEKLFEIKKEITSYLEKKQIQNELGTKIGNI